MVGMKEMRALLERWQLDEAEVRCRRTLWLLTQGRWN